MIGGKDGHYQTVLINVVEIYVTLNELMSKLKIVVSEFLHNFYV